MYMRILKKFDNYTRLFFVDFKRDKKECLKNYLDFYL